MLPGIKANAGAQRESKILPAVPGRQTKPNWIGVICKCVSNNRQEQGRIIFRSPTPLHIPKHHPCQMFQYTTLLELD